MNAPVVALVDVCQGRRDAAFCHYRMRLTQQRFTYDADGQSHGRSFDDSSQTRPARTYYEHVVPDDFVVNH